MQRNTSKPRPRIAAAATLLMWAFAAYFLIAAFASAFAASYR